MLYVGNATDKEADQTHLKKLQAIAEKEGAQFMSLDASLNAEISELEEAERKQYLGRVGH